MERHPGSTEAHRYLGTTPAPTSSWVERTATWTAAGRVEFDYVVDSQLTWDRLVVLLDGGEAWSLSRRNRVGRASVSVGAGTHTLRFAYIKDEQVNEGLDRAWVDNVELFSGGGMFETYDFSASEGLDGCGRYSTSPGPSARLLEITLGATGEPALSAQYVGACWDGSGSPWQPASASEAWPAAVTWATDVEPPDMEGMLTLAVTLPEALDPDLEPAAAMALSLLGSVSGGPVVALGRLPGRDEIAFEEGDVATWEQLRLGVLYEEVTTYSGALTDAVGRDR